jgi:hypothetical protein
MRLVKLISSCDNSFEQFVSGENLYGFFTNYDRLPHGPRRGRNSNAFPSSDSIPALACPGHRRNHARRKPNPLVTGSGVQPSAGLPSSHSFHSEVFSSGRLLSIPLVKLCAAQYPQTAPCSKSLPGPLRHIRPA